jgi:hypothetical protein
MDATCPICHQGEDGATHILGGCKTKEFTARYISRHNAAVRLIQRAISKGSRGQSHCIMDAGKESDLPATAQGTRLPDRLCPPGVDRVLWRKMRPDLAYIDRDTDGNYSIDLIEVGYCGDFGHQAKAEEKHLQHADLIRILRQAQHRVRQHTITLGHTGTIPSTTKNCLLEMGVSNDCTLKTLTKLHQLATTTVEEIVTRRRQLEREISSHSHACLAC